MRDIRSISGRDYNDFPFPRVSVCSVLRVVFGIKWDQVSVNAKTKESNLVELEEVLQALKVLQASTLVISLSFSNNTRNPFQLTAQTSAHTLSAAANDPTSS